MNKRSYVAAGPQRRGGAAVTRPLTPAVVDDACDVAHIDPARVAAVRPNLIGQASVDALAETFRALGDPTRVRVLDALSHGELCVCDIASLLGSSQSATSHQLRLLRAMRLVRTRRAGRMVYYALDDRHIVTLFRQGLRHVEESEAKPGRRLA